MENLTFEEWFKTYHAEACYYGGIDCTNPKQIALDSWQAAQSEIDCLMHLCRVLSDRIIFYDGEWFIGNDGRKALEELRKILNK